MPRPILIGLLTVCVFCLISLRIKAQDKPQPKHILILVTQADKMTSGKPTGLWLEEYAVPYNLFKSNGCVITTATLNGGKVPIDARSKPNAQQASRWKQAIEQLNQTVALNSVDISTMDAIVIPGGHGVMFDLADSLAATKVIETFNQQNKIIAAICHGPAALVNAKGIDGKPLVAGKDMTAFSDSEEQAVQLVNDMPFLLESKLKELGAKVTTTSNFKPYATQSGNLITGQNPASSHAAAELVIKALKQK
ncbi:MAG TPA: glutamine amidotransferase [Phycisphaerales bacterium]|nr:glutamine amidotransferase [Phycisphaerales bacterium]